MIKIIRASCTIAIIIFAPIALACEYPERVNIPNGSSATKDEMVAGQKGVKKFVVDMEDYIACLDEEEEQHSADVVEPDPSDDAQRSEMLVKKHNAAVDDREKVAAVFNDELRVYKDRGN